MIKTIQTNSPEIDVNVYFRDYKYAIQEHAPIKLSNGNWLHSYRVTKYQNDGMSLHEDMDEEQDAFEREMFD